MSGWLLKLYQCNHSLNVHNSYVINPATVALHHLQFPQNPFYHKSSSIPAAYHPHSSSLQHHPHYLPIQACSVCGPKVRNRDSHTQLGKRGCTIKIYFIPDSSPSRLDSRRRDKIKYRSRSAGFVGGGGGGNFLSIQT